MTITMLLVNTLAAAEQIDGLGQLTNAPPMPPQ
jgi:hypothetical protein